MLPGAATDELAAKLRLYTLTYRRATEEKAAPEMEEDGAAGGEKAAAKTE